MCEYSILKWHPVHYRINGWMINSRHGLRLYQHVFCLIQLLKMHSLTRLAHLYLTLRNQCMLQGLRQPGGCVYKERCCVGLHGSQPPRESHVGRLLSDWPSGPCIVTRNVPSRAAMATSPCCDKVHCPRVTSWSFFPGSGRFNCTIDNLMEYITDTWEFIHTYSWK